MAETSVIFIAETSTRATLDDRTHESKFTLAVSSLAEMIKFPLGVSEGRTWESKFPLGVSTSAHDLKSGSARRSQRLIICCELQAP